MQQLQNLKQDAEELATLLNSAKRPSVQSLLQREITSLNAKISKIEQEEKQKKDSQAPPTTIDSSIPVANYTTIGSFSWDQSTTTVSIYVSENLKDVSTVDPSSIKCVFTDDSFDLLVNGLNNKNYRLSRSNFEYPIIPEKSKYRIKKDMIVLSLYKKESNTWSGLEAKPKPKLPKPDTSDPNAGLMDMMKNMYEEGDPEMKRTIAKAWQESMNKKGEMPPM